MPTYTYIEYNSIIEPVPKYVDRDRFGIPVMEPTKIKLSEMNNGLWLTNLNNIRKNDSLAARKIVHSFSTDEVLRAKYRHFDRFLDQSSAYYVLTSFDFSMDAKMEPAVVIDRVFKNRRSGVLMQANGRNAIPTVGWLDADKYDLCFSGLRDGGTMIISSLGVNNPISSGVFLSGYHELRTRFPSTNIICVGDRISGMDSDVCFVKFEDSFGSWNRYQNYWQSKLINWDGTIPERMV